MRQTSFRTNRIIALIVAVIGLVGTSVRTAQSSEDLSGLSQDDQFHIQLACSNAGIDGAAAYNACVRQQLAALGNDRSADLSGLSQDDRFHIQLACSNAGADGPVAYNNCVSHQLAALGNSHSADLSGLSQDDRFHTQLACSNAGADGPAAYNNCVSHQLAALGNSHSADLSGLSQDDRFHIQLACSNAGADGPTAYNNCVKGQLVAVERGGSVNSSIPPLTPSDGAVSAVSSSYNAVSGSCAENGSCYGDISPITGLPKTIAVQGYYRGDGTYVRGYYRSH